MLLTPKNYLTDNITVFFICALHFLEAIRVTWQFI